MKNEKMKILFVCSGNSPNTGQMNKEGDILIKNAIHQGDSLIKMGYSLDFCFIKGKGILGYIKSIPMIRRCIKNGNYDVVHAHYSLSAIATSLAGKQKPVVSLMGSDIFSHPIMLLIIRIFCKYLWAAVIVKTEDMKLKIRSKNVIVLPNGVDSELFRPLDKQEARKKLNLPDCKIILFAANPSRIEKNFKLAEEALSILNRKDVMLLPVYNAQYQQMPIYMNASDVLLLTSFWEGSVNVVKEAMSCNLPIVSTNVGDVQKNINNLKGYYITTFNAIEIAKFLQIALDLNVNIDGVSRIRDLNLDAFSVNSKLIKIYESVINSQLI